MSRVDVLVIGSINQDLVIRVDRIPGPGETLSGQQQPPKAGGKGANQAVAAARLGAGCAMVGAVGGDPAGGSLRYNLQAAGVNIDHVRIDERAPTGSAVILVDPDGENVIVISPGANGLLDAEHVAALPADLLASPVTLLQNEVPLAVVAAAADRAEGLVVFNPAPANAAAADLLDDVDVVIPNEHELQALVGRKSPAMQHGAVEKAAAEVSTRTACIVTLGARGALVAEDGHIAHVPAFETNVVDTTGAGDAFCAGVAVSLAQGADLRSAAVRGAAAGACAVTALGAQSAMPTREQVQAFIERQ